MRNWQAVLRACTGWQAGLAADLTSCVAGLLWQAGCCTEISMRPLLARPCSVGMVEHVAITS